MSSYVDPKGSKAGVIVACVLGAIALVAIIVATSSGMSAKQDENYKDTLFVAESVCQEYVTDRLKVPSSAQFSSADVAPMPDDVYAVTASVSSENSFGAAVTHDYTCTVHDEGDDTFTLVDLTGLDDGDN